MFRRETVINRNNDTTHIPAQDPAERILRVEISHDESAAMKKHQQWKWASTFRGINANRNFDSRTGSHAIADLRNGCKILSTRGHLTQSFSVLFNCQLVEGFADYNP